MFIMCVCFYIWRISFLIFLGRYIFGPCALCVGRCSLSLRIFILYLSHVLLIGMTIYNLDVKVFIDFVDFIDVKNCIFV